MNCSTRSTRCQTTLKRKRGKAPNVSHCLTQCSNECSLGNLLFPRQDNHVQRYLCIAFFYSSPTFARWKIIFTTRDGFVTMHFLRKISLEKSEECLLYIVRVMKKESWRQEPRRLNWHSQFNGGMNEDIVPLVLIRLRQILIQFSKSAELQSSMEFWPGFSLQSCRGRIKCRLYGNRPFAASTH